MTILKPLVQADEEELEAARQIYIDSFPVRQREPFNDLVASIRAGGQLGWIQVEDGAPIGIAIAMLLESVDWLFLEYFAVERRARGKGYGTDLWAGLLDHGPVQRLVFEVEDPEDTNDSDERRLRQRRIEFYQRLGAELVGPVEYVVPNLTGPGTEQLLLMVYDAGRTNVGKSVLKRLLEALYREGYGLPKDHQLLVAAQKSVEHLGG